jgi:hypothetical protein
MTRRLSSAFVLAGLACAPLAFAQSHDCPSHRPPKEAFDACADAKEGDACTVKLPDRTLDGTCASFAGGGLACRPNGAPPPPPSGDAQDGVAP